MSIISSIFGRLVASDAPEGVLLREDGLVDIDLPVSSRRFASNGALTVVGRGRIEGETVALAIELEPEWNVQTVEDVALTLYWGHGAVRSVGPESDALLKLLAREYGVGHDVSTMALRTPVTVTGLNSDPRLAKSQKLTLKVFFEHGAAQNYGEAFINVDLPNGVLEFHDKDPEYHNGILASLAS